MDRVEREATGLCVEWLGDSVRVSHALLDPADARWLQMVGLPAILAGRPVAPLGSGETSGESGDASTGPGGDST